MKAVLIRKSTGEVIKHADYPNIDLEPVIGLDPDLEWLLKHQPFNIPDYDPRLYKLIRTEEITTDLHPDSTHLNQYKITFSTEKRPDEDIILAIENAETEANETLVDYTMRTKLFMLAIGVLIRRLDNLQTSPKEQAILDQALAIAVNIWRNDAEVQSKKDRLASGEEPDIDALWEKGQ